MHLLNVQKRFIRSFLIYVIFYDCEDSEKMSSRQTLEECFANILS
jgi:hypothetical protein